MTEPTPTIPTETEQPPTITLNVTAVLPIDTEDDNNVGFVLMADGTVRWSPLDRNGHNA